MGRDQDDAAERAARFMKMAKIGRQQAQGHHNQAVRRLEEAKRMKNGTPAQRAERVRQAKRAEVKARNDLAKYAPGGAGAGGGSSKGGCAVAALAFVSPPVAIVAAIAYHLGA
jgi:hypothetical protein